MSAAPPLAVHRFTAFGGARCEVLARGCTDADLSAAVAEVYAFEARLTRFDPGSELSRLNAAAGTRTAVSPLLQELLRATLDAFELSDGAVNAAVLPALLAAGYDRAAVDLGGVGKGWLADRLAERLEDAAVNLGGDLRALGPGPDGDGWTVGLCDGSAVRVVDAGIATSGPAGRRWA
ncbi:MAG TPA: FAD:protein FMN transferase, partial [Candidatus Dormibacteraeota bacterium]